MIAQAIKKNEPKISPKEAKKRLVNRGAILTFIELLLLTLILLSCKKEDKNMQTTSVQINTVILIGSLSETSNEVFYLSRTNYVRIKSMYFTGYLADNVTESAVSGAITLELLPFKNIVPDSGTTQTVRSIFMQAGSSLDNLSILVEPNKQIQPIMVGRIPVAAPNEIDVRGTLLITYEIIE